MMAQNLAEYQHLTMDQCSTITLYESYHKRDAEFWRNFKHMCTWSDIKWPSNNSTPRCRHKSRMICPTLLRNFPCSFFWRYLGTNTMWHLQSKRTCDKLVQSCIGNSSCLSLKGFPGGITYIFSHQIGRTYSGPPPEVEGLDQY